MEIHYYKICNSRLEEFSLDTPAMIDNQVPVWISIFTEDRTEIASPFGSIINDQLAMEYLLEPGSNVRMKFTGQWSVLDFHTVVEKPAIMADTITFVAGSNCLITIADKARSAMEEIKSQISWVDLPIKDELLHLIYLLFHELSSDNLQVVANARQRVETLAEIIDEQPKDLEPADIMRSKRDLGVIFGVLEDDYLCIGYLAKLRFRIDSSRYRELLIEIAEGLGQLKKSVARTESRLESIHLQYILTLQDLSNKRLSTLTILQAIFVPLTLITGIYGMNFAYMPELKWEYSYYWILGLMAIIAACELWFFYRHDWFD